jgi:hypothetical protein
MRRTDELSRPAEHGVTAAEALHVLEGVWRLEEARMSTEHRRRARPAHHDHNQRLWSSAMRHEDRFHLGVVYRSYGRPR